MAPGCGVAPNSKLPLSVWKSVHIAPGISRYPLAVTVPLRLLSVQRVLAVLGPDRRPSERSPVVPHLEVDTTPGQQPQPRVSEGARNLQGLAGPGDSVDGRTAVHFQESHRILAQGSRLARRGGPPSPVATLGLRRAILLRSDRRHVPLAKSGLSRRSSGLRPKPESEVGWRRGTLQREIPTRLGQPDPSQTRIAGRPRRCGSDGALPAQEPLTCKTG